MLPVFFYNMLLRIWTRKNLNEATMVHRSIEISVS